MGAIAGGGVALATWGHDGLLDAAADVRGRHAVGGMAWAAIPAFLKTRFDVNEILTSLMLTYVAALFLSILVHGPGRTPKASTSRRSACSPRRPSCR